MSNEDDIPVVYSSLFGWMPAKRLQEVVGQHNEPAIIFLFDHVWEENLFITQHNLTIIGASGGASVVGGAGDPTITVLKPNVRLVNIEVRNPHSEPCIAFTHAPASQAVIKDVIMSESGSHGIFRDGNYTSTLNAVIDCEFQNIEGNAIHAESGSGARNLVYGNRGENVQGEFINWGVNSSILLENYCYDASIVLTEESSRNMVLNGDDGGEVLDAGRENQLVDDMVEPSDEME